LGGRSLGSKRGRRRQAWLPAPISGGHAGGLAKRKTCRRVRRRAGAGTEGTRPFDRVSHTSWRTTLPSSAPSEGGRDLHQLSSPSATIHLLGQLSRGRSGFRIPIAEPGKPARQERLCVASLARGPRRHRSWHAGRPVRALWKAGMVAGAQSGPASADGERRMRRGIMPPAREITKRPQAEKPAPMHAVLSARARSIKACTVGSV
jgi:hypothetical protein